MDPAFLTGVQSNMLVLVLSAAVALQAPEKKAAEGAISQVGVCEREAPAFVHKPPVRVGKKVPQPKRIRYVAPKYPSLPPGTFGSGVWVGEFLIGPDGKVVTVWPIRQLQFTPPFPAFNQAIVDSIKQTLYEPLKIDGQPVPLCATVSVNINWS